MNLKKSNNERDIIDTLLRWLENRNAGKLISDYLKNCGFVSVGILDAGDIGRILYDEIKDSGINVSFFLDRNAESVGSIDDIPVRLVRDVFELPEVDVIIITPEYDSDEVNRFFFSKKPELKTICLKDAVSEM